MSARIGPAGENLVVSACVSVASNQVFGRGGLGAVRGEEITGLPWEKFGSKEFNDQFLDMVTYRKG